MPSHLAVVGGRGDGDLRTQQVHCPYIDLHMRFSLLLCNWHLLRRYCYKIGLHCVVFSLVPHILIVPVYREIPESGFLASCMNTRIYVCILAHQLPCLKWHVEAHAKMVMTVCRMLSASLQT